MMVTTRMIITAEYTESDKSDNNDSNKKYLDNDNDDICAGFVNFHCVALI